MSLLNPASAINSALKPALIFAAVAAQGMQADAADFYVDEETAAKVTYQRDPERVIRITGDIDDKMALPIIDRLYELAKKDPDAPIIAEVSSFGGEVRAGWSILDAMNSVRNPVTTICMGGVGSIAAFIAIGNKGPRYAMPHCRVMLHEPSEGIGGVMKFSALGGRVDGMGITVENFVEILQDVTGLPETYARELIKAEDLNLTAEQAVRLNLFQGILPERDAEQAPKKPIKSADEFCEITGIESFACSPKDSGFPGRTQKADCRLAGTIGPADKPCP